MFKSMIEAIGGTPMVRLNSVGADLGASIWVKLESRNPGGSIKDRIALYMIEGAMKRGELAPGGTIVEPTSGNTGIGLALLAGLKKLSCILTMPESMSVERRKILAAYGAKLVLTPAAKGMTGAVEEARRIAKETPGAVMLDQFSNPDCPLAHYEGTGPEILADLGQNIAAFVSATGTGGTLTGVGRKLKENIKDVVNIALEPALSPVLSGGKPGPHPIQGIGPGFIPAVLDRSVVDEVITVEGDAAMATARRLMREEGISCGISSGANVWGAMQLAARPEFKGKNIVTVICDGGERYLSTALFAE